MQACTELDLALGFRELIQNNTKKIEFDPRILEPVQSPPPPAKAYMRDFESRSFPVCSIHEVTT